MTSDAEKQEINYKAKIYAVKFENLLKWMI